MEITIEFIVLAAVILTFIIGFFWYILSKKYHNMRYKPENDKSRPYKRTIPGVDDRKPDVERSPKSKERGVSVAHPSIRSDKDTNSTGKDGKHINPFTRK